MMRCASDHPLWDHVRSPSTTVEQEGYASMSHQRRAIGLLAGGAMTVALLAGPTTAIAQDASAAPASAAPAATVSEACQASALESVLKNPGRLTLSTDNPAF